jgi:hypothetical protein
MWPWQVSSIWSRTALVSSAFVSLAEIDERDPDVAAVIDNVAEGFEIFFLAIELGRINRAHAAPISCSKVWPNREPCSARMEHGQALSGPMRSSLDPTVPLQLALLAVRYAIPATYAARPTMRCQPTRRALGPGSASRGGVRLARSSIAQPRDQCRPVNRVSRRGAGQA